MHLYYLETTDAEDVDYDQTLAAVVAATSAVDARKILSQFNNNDPSERWTNPIRSTCRRIGHAAGACCSQTNVTADLSIGPATT